MDRPTFRAPDGTTYTVTVELPSHSGALVFFLHPSGRESDHRYAWWNARGSHVADPRARLDTAALLAGLSDRDLARLFRRAVAVQPERPGYLVS